MKKFFVFFLCCVLAVSLSACGSKPAGQETGKPYKGSIEDLINEGKSVRCVLQANEEAGIPAGTTYVSGKNARSDYDQKGENNAKIASHFITDGTWMYSWNDVSKEQAVKFKIAEMQNEQFKNQADSQGAGDYADKMDYQCYSWSVDKSYFTPPAGINFQDMTELMKQFSAPANTNSAPDLKNIDTSALCGQCNQISDATSKEMCKKQLGCK